MAAISEAESGRVIGVSVGESADAAEHAGRFGGWSCAWIRCRRDGSPDVW